MTNSDNINIICNYSKFKYSNFDEFITSNPIGDILPTDKFIIVYDLTYILSMFKRICNIDNDATLDEETITHLSIGILNILAHYRHYISTKIKCGSVIIVYSSDESFYTDFDKIFTFIRKILNLFKKTIFIEKLDKESKYIYQHICYFTCMNIASTNNAINKRCRIVYIGNNILSMQMLRIDRDMIHVKHNYIGAGPDIFFKDICSNEGKNMMEIIVHKNIDLITSVLSLIGFKNGYPKLESIKNKKVSRLYDIMVHNCENGVDKDNFISIIQGLPLSIKDVELFSLRLKILDVDFHNQTYKLSKTLLKIWSSKIHTNSIHSINDFTKFNDIELSVQWLDGR